MSRPQQTQQGATAPAPAAVTVTSGGETFTITVPRTAQDIAAIRERRSELSNQLTSAADRRSEIAEELKLAEGPVRTGLEQRLEVLDKRIIQLESDIAETGQQLTSAPAGLIAASQSPLAELGIEPHLVERVSIMFTLFVMAPIAVSIAWAIFRRAMKPAARSVKDSEGGERLERLENAVDAIAVEIERISEGQRFVTRLLTEPSPDTSLASRRGEGTRLSSRSES
ncbi:MAG TPA: hypothetical protein VNO75_04585 [Gemmatimonadaceae bacterium]|nr:hypothetical protein [Gemmatimonadaceae bacterium]